MRNKDKEEEWRYKKWRKDWGKWWVIRSYLQVFMLQGFLLLIISLPVLTIMSTPVFSQKILEPVIYYTDLFGIFIWIIGFLFEAVGDYQLSRFLKDPRNKGKIIKSGLWKYTRHPNYFGEIAMWWGIWLMATKHPYPVLSILGPITITVLLRYVSGVPLLEKKMMEKPEFRKYAKKTNMLIPWFPKEKV
jgi:steroid 5-alpha reductase family enzyme